MHGDVSHWIELGLWTRPSDKRVREANDDLIRDKGKVQRQRDGLAAKGSRSRTPDFLNRFSGFLHGFCDFELRPEKGFRCHPTEDGQLLS